MANPVSRGSNGPKGQNLVISGVSLALTLTSHFTLSRESQSTPLFTPRSHFDIPAVVSQLGSTPQDPFPHQGAYCLGCLSTY